MIHWEEDQCGINGRDSRGGQKLQVVCGQVAMAEHHALGQTRRARGIGQGQDVIATDLDRGRSFR